MELSDLLIFKTVVSQGGIVRAAHKLDRVQSNVTQRIKQLEADLSTTLFVREGKGLQLTASGQVLLAYADQLLQIADEARSAVGTAPLHGVLKIGANEGAAASHLPRILSDFSRKFPDITVDLSTSTDDALVTSLANRSIDAAFITSPPTSNKFLDAVIAQEQLILITANEHAPVNHPDELKPGVVVVFAKGCSYRRALELWLGTAALTTRQIKEQCSYHAVIAAVAAGSGFAAVPKSVLSVFPSGYVRCHEITSLGKNISTVLLWRKFDQTLIVKSLASLLEQRPGNSST